MIDVFGIIGAGSTLTLVALCYKLSSDKNGKYVHKETCDLLHKENKLAVDNARNIMETKILAIKDDVIEIKADVKELLRNGKRRTD